MILNALPRPGAEPIVAFGADIEGRPRRLRAHGHELGLPDQRLRQRVVTNEDEDLVADGRVLKPHGGGKLRVLHVDAFRHDPQGQLAQGAQGGRLEEILGRAPARAFPDINLAIREALQEIFRRQIDQFDFIGAVENAVGYGLVHPDAGDLGDDVVQALQMLHVERGHHIDAVGQQFLDVLPSLGVPGARRVGVRQLVDEDQAGLARQGRVKIELVQDDAAIVDLQPRQDGQAFRPGGGFVPAVMFDNADDDVAAGVPEAKGFGQHGIGLAHAGRGAEEDFQTAAPAVAAVAVDQPQELVRIWPSILAVHRRAPQNGRGCETSILMSRETRPVRTGP